MYYSKYVTQYVCNVSACSCFKPGTLTGSNVCNTETGQCMCKPDVGGRDCDSCRDGFYNLQESNPFGCTSKYQRLGFGKICFNPWTEWTKWHQFPFSNSSCNRFRLIQDKNISPRTDCHKFCSVFSNFHQSLSLSQRSPFNLWGQIFYVCGRFSTPSFYHFWSRSPRIP